MWKPVLIKFQGLRLAPLLKRDSNTGHSNTETPVNIVKFSILEQVSHRTRPMAASVLKLFNTVRTYFGPCKTFLMELFCENSCSC